ncbi:MAG: acetylxylan esterase [Phycisphaerae bacterium]|nr:acetylxylan esterase [Phycisphaerae bacterium]
MIARHGAFRTWMLCTGILVLGSAFTTAQPGAIAPLTIQSSERSGIYDREQEVVFTIAPARGAASVNGDAVVATVTRDGWEKLASTNLTRKGEALEVRFTPQSPGWYMCEVSSTTTKATARAGVVVNPDKIKASMPEPDDLDSFWNARRDALKAMPLRAEMSPVESTDPDIACVSVELPCPQSNPVRGYLAQPKEIGLRGAPAILYLRAAGVSGDWCKASPQHAASLAKRYGAMVLDINAHGMLNDQPAEYYRQLEQGELRNYWAQGNDDKNTFYFVGMYTRLLRAIEFITTRDAWNGKHLVAIGESQGGGQALAAAGLDKRVSAVVALVPAMCDFTGPVVGRSGGWPQPVGADVQSPGARKIIDAVRYCDNVHLAKRSQAETLIFVGLIDTTCPPHGIIATYNNLPGKKWILMYPHKPHNGLPQEDLWLGDISGHQDMFIRGHFGP